MKRTLPTAGLQYTPLTKKALALCWSAHKDQLDKSGLPYFIHPLHLAEQMDTEEAICHRPAPRRAGGFLLHP